MSFKKLLKNSLENHNHHLFKKVNAFLAVTIIVSIFSLILETVPELQSWNTLFLIIEWFAVTIFLIEYFVRIYIADNKIRYIFSLYGLIDLISILPSIFFLTNLTFLKSGRLARLIRLLRIVRLAKVRLLHKRHAPSNENIIFFSIYIYSLTILLGLLILGSLLYLAEKETGVINHIPAGMLATLEIVLGESSNYQIQTALGRIIAVAARFFSFLLLGLLISLLDKILVKHLLGDLSTKPKSKRIDRHNL